MAKLTTIIQCATISVVYLVLKLAFIDTAGVEGSPCSFPSGSIACKIWNYTNMDCGRRELVCIPPLRHKASLESLYLGNNKLTVLSQDSFSGLIKLKTLDLSFNNISTIYGGTFTQLNLLQTLYMAHNSIQSLSDDIFSGLHNLLTLYLNDNNDLSIRYRIFNGLGKLQTLDVSRTKLTFTPDSPPFKSLHSLRTLSAATTAKHPFSLSSTIFAGLNHTLQVLYISALNITTDTPFIQLSSLQYLSIHLRPCNHVSKSLFVGLDKLKYLSSDCFQDYSPLVSLTYLSYYIRKAVPDTLFIGIHIQSLNTLSSLLQTLDLHFLNSAEFNSTTFEALPKWKESLQELNIYFEHWSSCNIHIKGSPFKWFLQLQRLRIGAFPAPSENFRPTVTWTYPLNTFKGLPNLKELHLNYLNIDAIISLAVQITCTDYPLEVLDLAHNIIATGYTSAGKISSIPTLKILDLSHNFDGQHHQISLDLAWLCNNNFNLTTLDIKVVYIGI